MSVENANDFQAVYQCYSTAFLADRERNDIEHGGKILLPQSVLEQLINNQTGVMLFKLTNLENDRFTHCGVLEFLPDDEQICYVPHWIMEHLLLDEGEKIHIQSIDSLPSATFVCFQPKDKQFLDLTNPKAILERSLRNFNCLTQGDLITINYLNRNYQLIVVELKPTNIVSIIECDLEVDFILANENTNHQISKMIINEHDLRKLFPLQEQKNSSCSNELRGKPNYNYKYGLLEFPRSNENQEKQSSMNTFQPFTGEGKSLRPSRNQRPK